MVDPIQGPPPSIQQILNDPSIFSPTGPLDTLESGGTSAPTINAVFSFLATTRLDLKADLHQIEYLESSFHEQVLREALNQVAETIAKYNEQTALYGSTQINVGNTDNSANDVNNSAHSANGKITDVQNAGTTLNANTSNYNSAVDQFNTAYTNGFPNDVERDASITAYNASATTYNNYVTSYNNAVAAANLKITDYNTAVDNFNAQVNTNNAEIDLQNITRQLQGLTPLPHQTYLVHKDLIASAPLAPILPLGPVSGPIGYATNIGGMPTTIPDIIVPGSLNLLENFLAPNFLPQYIEEVFFIGTLSDIFGKLLEDRVLPNAGIIDITRADSVNRKNAQNSVQAGGGSGGIGLSSLAVGLDPARLDAIMGKAVLDELVKHQQLDTTPTLLQQIQPFSVSIFIRSNIRGALPGLGFVQSDLKIANNNAVRIAVALGSLASVLGFAKNSSIEAAFASVAKQDTSLASLSEKNRSELIANGGALIAVAVLNLTLGSTAVESNTPELLNAADAALITTIPGSSGARFGTVGQSFEQLLAAYDAGTLSVLLGQFLSNRLQGLPIPAQSTPEDLGQTIVDNLASQGVPGSAEELKGRIASLVGQPADSEAVDALFKGTVLFVIGAAAKRELQNNLTEQQIGPRGAAALAREISTRVFGFSVDFNTPAVIFQNGQGNDPVSIQSALADELAKLEKKDDIKFTQAVTDDFSRLHETVNSLEAFLRKVIDPGQQLFGVMYDQQQGNVYDGKDRPLDIQL